MNEYNLLVLDNSINNTETPTQINHVQKLDLEQTNRLMSRMALSRYAKEMANDILGFSQGRLGQPTGSVSNGNMTATEVKTVQVGSYNRTETYFINHADQLMPRVHEMRTMLAQYYFAKKPNFVLNMMISADERALFDINGIDLIGRDCQVFTDNSSSRRTILNNIVQWLVNTNTNGGSIMDIPELMQVRSLTALDVKLKQIEEKQAQKEELSYAREMEALDKKKEIEGFLVDKQNNFIALQNMLDRQAKHLDEQIRSSGYAASQDINENKISDQIDLINSVKADEQYKNTMQHNREESSKKSNLANKELQIKNRKIDADLAISANQVTIAEKNKNRFDK